MPTVVRARIVKIGNSRGIRIPKVLLEQGKLGEKVELELGVPEVWFWRNGTLHIRVLDGEATTGSPRSRLLPDLDRDLIVRFMSCPSQT